MTETPQRLAMARAVAGESIVLLQNRGNVLPLRSPRRIAMIGRYCNPPDMYLGGYSSKQEKAGVAKSVNAYQGLKAAIRRPRPRSTSCPALPDFIDPASIAAAAHYDAVVVYVGTDRSTASEDNDRVGLALPGAQAELIRRVAAANPHTIAYLETVGQVDVSAFQGAAPAILWSSYNGQQQGAALADVLTGAVDATGRLPFTWYRDERPTAGDRGLRDPARAATTRGRTYQYFTGAVDLPVRLRAELHRLPLVGLRIDRTEVDAGGTVQVTATVTNTGAAPAPRSSSCTRPRPTPRPRRSAPASASSRSAKIALQPHQSTRVAFPVRIADLAFFDEQADSFQVDQGRYGLQLAASSADRDVRQPGVRVGPRPPAADAGRGDRQAGGGRRRRPRASPSGCSSGPAAASTRSSPSR